MPMICSQLEGELHSSRERSLKPRYIVKYDFACNTTQKISPLKPCLFTKSYLWLWGKGGGGGGEGAV